MSSPRRGTRRAREAGEEPEEPGPARQVPRPNRFVETQSDAAYAAYQTVESVLQFVLEDGDEPGAALFFLVIMAMTAFSARMEARERVGSDPVQARNDDGSLRFTEDGIGAFRKWNKAVRDSRKTAERTCEQRSAARTALCTEMRFQIAIADERHPTPSGTLRPYAQQRASLGTGAEIPKNLSGPALAAAQAESEGTSTCGICTEHMDGSIHHDANDPTNSYDRLPGRLACGCTKYCMGCIRRSHKAADDAARRQHQDPPSHYMCPARCAEASPRGAKIPYEVLGLKARQPSQDAVLRAVAGIACCPSVPDQMARSGVPTEAELAARPTFPITNAAMRTEQRSRDPAYTRRLCVPGEKPVYRSRRTFARRSATR